MANVKVSSKVGKTSNLWYHVKGLAIRNTHKKYESPASYALTIKTFVKVFDHVTDADADTRAITNLKLAPRTYAPTR